MSSVAVYSYTHSVTYVADNILKSLKDIVRLSGLDPTKLTDDWESIMRALRAWLDSGHLRTVVLEVFDPATDELVTRWDVDIVYSWSSGDGSFWTDTEQLKYAIRKAGVAPGSARYRILMDNRARPPGRRGLVLYLVPLNRWDGEAERRLHSRAQRTRRQHRLLEEGLMLSVDEAFRKFKSRLELNDKEQQNASARQTEVRDYLDTKFRIDRSFLTGSYARWTKTKPLKDVDIFFVLGSDEEDYRSKAPSVVLADFEAALRQKYGDQARRQNRSINVDFGVKADADDNTNYRVISVDVVPAFAAGDDFEIPDDATGSWIKTNPRPTLTRRLRPIRPIRASGRVSCGW